MNRGLEVIVRIYGPVRCGPRAAATLPPLIPSRIGRFGTRGQLKFVDSGAFAGFLKALKYSRRPDLADCMGILLAEAPALEEDDLVVILTYLDKGPIALNNVIHETLQRLVPDRKERIMGSLTQPYYDKGVAEGEAKGEARGEARGEAKGEAKILARFLEKRFGAVPAAVRQRIFAADVRTIEAWVERAFDAPDLQSIFESN